MRKFLIAILVFFVLLGGSFLLGMLIYLSSSSDGGLSFGGGRVAVITLEGGIFDPTDTVEEIEKYRKDGDIKAAVIRIESPGGAVAASQEVFNSIAHFSQVKPIVASLGSIAASGGYYAACGATKIVANPGTITGSIGVRMEHVELGELLRWAKIRHETLKSGKFKDIASPDRPLTPEERAILEHLLLDVHQQFKDDVAKSRSIPPEEIDAIADGRIFSGSEAQKLRLVDELGGFSDAVRLAGKLANIKGEPEVTEKYKRHPKWLSRVIESAISELKFQTLQKKFEQPSLVYWGY